MNYDFIGDVHGYAGKLTQLLSRLGYKPNGRGFSHPDRKAFFLGDYINRGPEIVRALEIIRTMIDHGDALAIMGNHEYYAICFKTPKSSGGYLRRHSIKNILNQSETFRQFRNDEKLYSEYLEWFTTLPLFYEEERFRAVHACWDFPGMAVMKKRLPDGRLKMSVLEESRERGTELCSAIETALKGKEIPLPATSIMNDKEQEPLTEFRIRWWEDPVAKTYRVLSVQPDTRLPDTIIPASDLPGLNYYRPSEKPVFFGHYGLTIDPALFRDNVCCLDLGVAKGRYMTAYRFDNELKLYPEKLVYVS